MAYLPLDASQIATSAAALNKLKVYSETEGAFAALLSNLGQGLLVNGVDLATYATIGQLVVSSENDKYSQAEIDPGAVARVVFGVPTTKIPALLDGVLLNPPILGYHNDGSFSIIAGRHRLTAILTLAKLSGVDVNSPEFLATKIRVLADVYSIDGVQGYNTSRRIRNSESLSTELQKLGVNPSDIGAILNAYRSNTVKVGTMFPAVYLCLTTQLEEAGKLDPSVAKLTSATLVDIAKGVPSKFGAKYPAYRPGFKNFDWTQVLLTHSFKVLPAAIAAVEAAGVTNLARSAPAIAAAIVHQLKDLVGKEIAAPVVPTKAPKVAKEKTASEPKDASDKPKATRVRGAKAAKVVAAEDAAQAESEATNEVI